MRETARSSIDTLHFKLQKPISKDESSKKIKKNSSRKRWWRNALLFFKRTKSNSEKISGADGYLDDDGEVHHRRPNLRGSISGPVYITESRSGSNTPYRTTSRPSSGPLAGTGKVIWRFRTLTSGSLTWTSIGSPQPQLCQYIWSREQSTI